MLPKNFNEPMGAPAIFEKQIEITRRARARLNDTEQWQYPAHLLDSKHRRSATATITAHAKTLNPTATGPCHRPAPLWSVQ
ncbi:MAG: hypothetical protein P8X74_23505 [Reinekea sp.]